MFNFGGSLLKVEWDLLRWVSCSLRRTRETADYAPGLWDSPLLRADEEEMGVVLPCAARAAVGCTQPLCPRQPFALESRRKPKMNFWTHKLGFGPSKCVFEL